MFPARRLTLILAFAAVRLAAQPPACDVEVRLLDAEARPALVRVVNRGAGRIVAALAGASIETGQGHQSASWQLTDSVLTGLTERDLAPGESRDYSFLLQHSGRPALRAGFLAADGGACGDPEVIDVLQRRREAIRAELPAALAKIRELRVSGAGKTRIRAAFAPERLRVFEFTTVEPPRLGLPDPAPGSPRAAMFTQVLFEINRLEDPLMPALTAAQLLDRLEQALTGLQARLG